MNISEFSETQRIEFATATGFFDLYNASEGTHYQITHVAEPGEVPDILARDSSGNEFNIEITLTEDYPGDIPNALSRNDNRSVENLIRHLDAVRTGKERLRVTSLEGTALLMLMGRIEKKLIKRYGRRTALLIRDTSPLWDWEPMVSGVTELLEDRTVPFDLGVWILSSDMKSCTLLYLESST